MPALSLHALALDWLDWKNTSKPSEATLRARKADLAVIGEILCRRLSRPDAPESDDPFERFLIPLHASDLTRDEVTGAFAAYARTHAPSSIRRCRSTWSGFCRWMVVYRSAIEMNPLDFVEPPPAKRWRPKPISEADLGRIIRAAQTPAETARRPWPQLEQAICALFVGAGVRVSEVISLRVGDVHRSHTEMDKLHVTGKGGVTRTIPLPPETVAFLDSYIQSRTERFQKAPSVTDRLFVKTDNRPLSPKTIDHLVLGWFRRAAVAPPAGALAHALRHTYATLLVEQSGSVPEVQRLLGHSDMATTQAYVDVAAKGVEETAMANPGRRLLAEATED